MNPRLVLASQLYFNGTLGGGQDMAQWVERLPSMHKALGSVSSATSTGHGGMPL